MSGIAELRLVKRKVRVVHAPEFGGLEYWADPVLQSRVSGGEWEDVPVVLLDDEILDTTDS